MDSLLSGDISSSQLNVSQYSAQIQFSKDSLVIESTLVSVQKDSAEFDFSEVGKSLSIKAQKIIEKLNELLKAKIPDGIQSLKPEDNTPEITAENIVRGATAFFDVFAKQNSNLSGEDLLNKFMETIRSGVEQGYGEAYGILEGLGAFDIEGVRDGVEETKRLIEQKLAKYEELKREELGLPPKDTAPQQLAQKTASSTELDLLAQAGASLRLVA